MVTDAFIKQMEDEAVLLREAKGAVEAALASGADLSAPIDTLNKANDHYKNASVPVRKHAVPPKAPKAASERKPKAKAKP